MATSCSVATPVQTGDGVASRLVPVLDEPGLYTPRMTLRDTAEADDPLDDLIEAGAERVEYVLSKDATFRLDKYLQNRMGGISRNQIQRLIDLGGVTVNDRETKASQRLKQGDVVGVLVPPRPGSDLVPEDIPIGILHEEAGFVVVNKPAGLIVHPARGKMTGTLLNALAYHFQQHGSGELSDVGKEDVRPGVIHRLDKDTTGVMIVGKREHEHWRIAKQFEARTNLKVYLAVVHGCPDPPGGAIDGPLGRHPSYREAMAVRHDSASRAALSLYRVRERYRGYSLVEVELKTGRTHQIRVHMQYLGHPLAGDIIYGGEPVGFAELNDPAGPPEAAGSRPNMTFARSKEEGLRVLAGAQRRDDLILTTPALHATLLRLNHPTTGEPMTFTAPVPDPMRGLVHELRQRPAVGQVETQGVHVDLAAALG